MSDGWVPPCYPNEEELVAKEEKLNSRRKATLVKRHVCVKAPQFEVVSKKEFMEKNDFSVMAYPLMEGPYSGEGDDKTFWIIVFYEPGKKTKVERAFKSAGFDLGEYEQVPVDPDTKMEEEKQLMDTHGNESTRVCVMSEYEWTVVDKGTPEYDDPWGPKHPDGPWWE